MHKNQKGFLIVLCLCMLSVSGIFGVYQYQRGQTAEPETAPQETARSEETEISEKEAANSRGTVAKADTEEETTEEAKIETEEDIYEIGEAELAKAEEAPQEAPAEETPQEEITETGSDQIQADLLAFSEDNTLLWPVEGNVILNYSMDKSIYFSTLNQYKYHPAIVISAEVGTEVQSAARGMISRIEVDEETGTTLTMDLGSGYEAVYGQLKEVSVKEGDMVEAGTLLGYVSEPTMYYTLEGSNLYFQLLKDGEPVNPMNYIQ